MVKNTFRRRIKRCIDNKTTILNRGKEMKVKELIEKLKGYNEDLEVVIYDEDNDYTMNITNVITDKSNEVDYERIAIVKQ
jgi:hemerythrin-like domain-containing protein